MNPNQSHAGNLEQTKDPQAQSSSRQNLHLLQCVCSDHKGSLWCMCSTNLDASMSAQFKHIIRTRAEQLVPAVSAVSSCFALSVVTDPTRAVPPCVQQGSRKGSTDPSSRGYAEPMATCTTQAPLLQVQHQGKS